MGNKHGKGYNREHKLKQWFHFPISKYNNLSVAGSCYVAQIGLKFLIPLLLTPGCWDCKWVPPHPDNNTFFLNLFRVSLSDAKDSLK